LAIGGKVSAELAT